jgi:hypothetical protein
MRRRKRRMAIRRLDDHAGIITTCIGYTIATVVFFYIITNILPPMIEQTGQANTSGIASAVSFADTTGKASGEITKLSSVGNDYMLNFKDDLSDYRFTGVDQTELDLLQYAFQNQESVTVTYTVDGDLKNLEGVTLSSPVLPPVTDTTAPAKTDDGFHWWIIIPPIISCSVTAYIIFSSRRRSRAMDRMIENTRRRYPVRYPSSEIEDQLTDSKPKKKKKEEPETPPIVPLDSKYRLERADALLGEKDKNKKFRKKKSKED